MARAESRLTAEKADYAHVDSVVESVEESTFIIRSCIGARQGSEKIAIIAWVDQEDAKTHAKELALAKRRLKEVSK